MKSSRWLKLSVVFLTIGASCPIVWAQQNVKRELGSLLNTNGGWEDGKGHYYFTRPTASFIDNDEVYRGQAALRLQGEGTPNVSEANIAVQGFAIPAPGPRTHYLFRVAVKARGVDPRFAPSVQFRREDAQKNLTVMEPRQGVIGADEDWHVVEIDSGPLPENARTLSFWLHVPSQSKATVWFDEIEVREILNPPASPLAAVPPPAPQVQPVAAVIVAPKPVEAPKPAPAPAAPLGWNLDLNQSNLSLYERGATAFAILSWTGAGQAPPPPQFALFDQNDRQLRQLAAEPAAAGGWRINLPTDRMGYFEIRPLAAQPEAVISALGSRPAGRLTFAVVDKIDPNPSHNFTTAFLSTQGTTLIQQDKPGFGWDMLPYMGVQAQGVGYQWSRLEADGPGTFEKNIANDKQPEWVRQMKIVPYFHLNGAPMWAVDASRLPEKERKGASTQRVPPKDWNQWEAYLEKLIPYLVKQYDFLPQRTYEVMWEPVIPWGWYGTPEEIVKNFEIAHRVIRKYDPKGRIAGPTLSGLNDTAYYETLLKAGLGQYLDVVAFHPYKGYPPEKNAIPEALRNIRELTKKYSGRDLPFIGTEFGFPQANAGSALNQGYGLTASVLIFKGEGARQHTLFYMADYAGEPGYGMNYNLVPGLPFGTSKLSPKPGVPMIRAAIGQIGNAEPVGKLDYLGADIWGYVFRDNADGTLLASLWDSSDRNRTVQLETGMPRVTQLDCFGNAEPQTTQDGRLTLQLGRAPIYVRGLSPQLYGPGRLEPLINTGEVWKVYRGRTTTQKLGFNRDLGGPNATLTFDTAADVSAEQLRQPVVVRRGQTAALTFPVSATAPLGPAAANLRLRDGDNTLYRGVQRIEVARELEIQPPSARRRGAAWTVESQVKNVSPYPWDGTVSLQLAGGTAQQRNLTLAPGASTEVSFPIAGGRPTETIDAALNFASKENARLAQTGRLSFFEINRRPQAADFWSQLPAIEVPGTPETIWKQHPDSPYHGPDDLSFKAGYAYDDQNLYVQIVVRDDVHRQVASPGTTWSQDNVQLAFDIAPGRGENANLVAEGFERTRSEWSLAFTPRGPEIFLNTAPGGTLVPESQVVTYPGAKLEGGRQEKETVYRLTLPWKLLDPRGVRDQGRLGVSAAVNDSDADTAFGDRRGLELFGGILRTKDTSQFGVAQLQP